MRAAFSTAIVNSMEVVLHSIDFISTGFSKLDCCEKDYSCVWAHLSIDL